MNLIKRNILLASLISMFSLCAIACDGGSCTVGDNKSKPTNEKSQTVNNIQERLITFIKKNAIKIGVGSTGFAAIMLSLKNLVLSSKIKRALHSKCPTQKTLGWTGLVTGLAIVAYGILSQENEINEEGEEISTESNYKTIAGGTAVAIAGITAALIKQEKPLSPQIEIPKEKKDTTMSSEAVQPTITKL